MVKYKRVRVKTHIRKAKPTKYSDRTHAPVKAHYRKVKK